jgi:uncharacterized repeat protein (TIGR01451 family)
VQLGRTVHYRVVVSNTGDAPLQGVFVVDLLPREVTFVSAPLPDQVEAALYGKVGSQENITWNVGTLRPGQSLTLPWSGIVVAAGDMTAVNAVRAKAAGTVRTRREDRTYVATSSSAGGANPVPTPAKTTVVTVSRVPAGGVLGSPDAAGETVPLTGFDPRSTLLLAVLLLGVGGVAWWGGAGRSSRRTKVVVALTALALLAACTASRDEAAPGTTISPQVKGKRIDRNGDVTAEEDPGKGSGDRQTDGNPDPAGSDAGSDTADRQGPPSSPAPPDAAPAPLPPTVVVRTTRIVTVAPVLRPPRALASRSGDNAVAYTWDHDASTILSASSSTTFAPSSPARLETSVVTASGAAHAVTTITNTSKHQRLVIDGRISYDLRSASGRVASLVSGPIRVTLNPGGSTRVSFDYDLPSGTYSATSRYEAN